MSTVRELIFQLVERHKGDTTLTILILHCIVAMKLEFSNERMTPAIVKYFSFAVVIYCREFLFSFFYKRE